MLSPALLDRNIHSETAEVWLRHGAWVIRGLGYESYINREIKVKPRITPIDFFIANFGKDARVILFFGMVLGSCS
jgi:hypothetical protein